AAPPRGGPAPPRATPPPPATAAHFPVARLRSLMPSSPSGDLVSPPEPIPMPVPGANLLRARGPNGVAAAVSATLDRRARRERRGRGGCRSPVLAERDHRRLQSRVPVPPGSLTEELETALTAVARAVAESLELREVWGPVADACRAVVPFDAMGVSQFQGADRVVAGATAGDPGARGLQERAFARTDFSPRLWPRATSYLVRIEDAAAELDLSFPVDRELVSLGFRSILRLPLVQGDLALGSLV